MKRSTVIIVIVMVDKGKNGSYADLVGGFALKSAAFAHVIQPPLPPVLLAVPSVAAAVAATVA